jgi:GNAT superfamily N-acetyltransferase
MISAPIGTSLDRFTRATGAKSPRPPFIRLEQMKLFKWQKKESTTDGSPTFTLVEAPISKWPKGVAGIRSEVFPPRFVASPLPRNAHSRAWILGAVVNRKTVGFAFCHYPPDATYIILEEVGITVSYQGQGLGRRLALDCARRAIQLGFEEIVATPLPGEDVDRRKAWPGRLGLSAENGYRSLLSVVIDGSQQDS